jgi:hypothetical protein
LEWKSAMLMNSNLWEGTISVFHFGGGIFVDVCCFNVRVSEGIGWE